MRFPPLYSFSSDLSFFWFIAPESRSDHTVGACQNGSSDQSNACDQDCLSFLHIVTVLLALSHVAGDQRTTTMWWLVCKCLPEKQNSNVDFLPRCESARSQSMKLLHLVEFSRSSKLAFQSTVKKNRQKDKKSARSQFPLAKQANQFFRATKTSQAALGFRGDLIFQPG